MFASTSTFGKPSPSYGFGTNSMFNATSSGVFGSSSAPPFTNLVPAFGTSSGISGATQSSPAASGFGVFSKPFGTSAPAFGEKPAFGGFGSVASQASSSPGGFGAFRASSSASSSPSFNIATSSAPSFTSAVPAFGIPSMGAFTKPFGEKPAFGGFGSVASQTNSSTPSFDFGFTSSNSQSSFTPGGNPTGTTSPFTFGTNTTVGQSVFQFKPKKGSRITCYRRTDAVNDTDNKYCLKKLVSISAMPDYIDKSHDELRWEDYELQGKAPPVVQSNPFGIFATISPPPSTQPSNPSIFQTSPTVSEPTRRTSPFSLFPTMTAPVTTSQNTPPFPSVFMPPGSTVSTTISTPSLFSPSPTTKTNSFLTSPFSTSPTTKTDPFLTTPFSAFPSTNSFVITPSPSKPLEGSLFPSLFTTPAISPASTSTFTPSPFVPFSTIMPSATTSSATQNSAPSLFCPPNSSPLSPYLPTIASPTSLSTTPNSVPSVNLLLSDSSPSISSSSIPSIPSTVSQPSQDPPKPAAFTVGQNAISVNPINIPNPFGTPSLSTGHYASSPSIRYGISSIPVADKPTSVRVTSLLTTRHLSQRRIRLPAKKLHPRVPFYCGDEESLSNKMADTLLLPRENPRALLISPKASVAKESLSSGPHNHVRKDGGLVEKASGQSVQGDLSSEADIEAKMPKLKHNDYYTEPPVQELAAKERAEPGFCQHVKDFVIGRHGFGSVLFVGETDVRELDLESLIQFNAREVTVYMDASKKPPVGEGLNKPAIVTLLNIKCFDKKTGQQITKGEKMEKYKDLLLKKAREQDAEFVSYDPLVGEWKFRVDHF